MAITDCYTGASAVELLNARKAEAKTAYYRAQALYQLATVAARPDHRPDTLDRRITEALAVGCSTAEIDYYSGRRLGT